MFSNGFPPCSGQARFISGYRKASRIKWEYSPIRILIKTVFGLFFGLVGDLKSEIKNLVANTAKYANGVIIKAPITE